VGHGPPEPSEGLKLVIDVDRVVVTAQGGKAVKVRLGKDPFDALLLFCVQGATHNYLPLSIKPRYRGLS